MSTVLHTFLCYFYPRPPRGGRPSAKRLLSGVTVNFYPRPPRGGRLGGTGREQLHRCISIHALREEGDASNGSVVQRWVQFLSTPSARRATTTL